MYFILFTGIKIHFHLSLTVLHVRFRSDWPVERVGKWREADYTAPVYPSFACGAGNVLSAVLVKWLALNADYLKSYQVNANFYGTSKWLSGCKSFVCTECFT